MAAPQQEFSNTRRARRARVPRSARLWAAGRPAPVERRTPLRAWLWPVAVSLVVCALFLSTLRNRILNARYELSEARQTELSLEKEVKKRRAAVESLRHPARLQALAAELGLQSASRTLLAPQIAEAKPTL